MSKVIALMLDRLQALAVENHDLKTQRGGGVMASEIEPYDPAGLREALREAEISAEAETTNNEYLLTEAAFLKAGWEEAAEEHRKVIARLQSELSELGSFSDECQERSHSDRDELEKACAEIEALKVERDALIASVDAHLDELKQLKDRMALQEAAAESVSDEARMAQDHAAWVATGQALRQASKAETSVVVIEATPIESSKSNVASPTLPIEEPEPAFVMPPAPVKKRLPALKLSKPQIDEEIRKGFVKGKTAEQISMALKAIGVVKDPTSVRNRAFNLGLRAADRDVQVHGANLAHDRPGAMPEGQKPAVQTAKARTANDEYAANLTNRKMAATFAAGAVLPEPSEAHQRVIEKAKGLPAIVVPETPKPGMSRIAQTHGERMLAMANEGYSPDDIAAELNIGAGINDRVNSALVRKALVELKAAQRGAA